jgi:hypothetical protein
MNAMSERARLDRMIVAALVASAASAGCYDVPALEHDSGAADSDGSSVVDSGYVGHPMDSGGPGDDGSSPPQDAACTGVLCPCNNAADCTGPSNVCAQSLTVGGALITAAGTNSFCTLGCCTSADCPTGTVCFASGQGGQYCVSPSWLGRSTPATSAQGGATCSTGSDCRSGLCAGNRCADTCCSWTDSTNECTEAAQCVFGTFPGASNLDTHFAPNCSAGGGTPFGNSCGVNGDCQGGLCYQTGMGAYCTQPCRVQNCGFGYACQVDQQGNDLYAACFPWMPDVAEGQGCSSDDVCQSDWCLTSNQLCTSICFTNSDCMSGWTCTPQATPAPQATTFPTGNYVLLACGP